MSDLPDSIFSGLNHNILTDFLLAAVLIGPPFF